MKFQRKDPVDDVIKALDELKKKMPDTEITVETTKGSCSTKIKDALVYEGMDGSIVIDAE